MNTNTLNTAKVEKLSALLRSLGISPFQYKSCDTTRNAQQNLEGKTHFVDTETLRGFRSRILAARHSCDGLIFWLVLSVNSKPTELKKNKRFVCFDAFGAVLNDRNEWHRTSEQARKAGYQFLNAFDAVEHTRKELEKLAKRKFDESNEITATIENL